jgi:hypothetical protein
LLGNFDGILILKQNSSWDMYFTYQLSVDDILSEISWTVPV